MVAKLAARCPSPEFPIWYTPSELILSVVTICDWLIGIRPPAFRFRVCTPCSNDTPNQRAQVFVAYLSKGWDPKSRINLCWRRSRFNKCFAFEFDRFFHLLTNFALPRSVGRIDSYICICSYTMYWTWCSPKSVSPTQLSTTPESVKIRNMPSIFVCGFSLFKL